MAVPDFQSILLPLLKFTASRAEVSTTEAYDFMGQHFRLSKEDALEPMPSGRGFTFRNRVAWAKQYLIYASLVEPVRRGISRATDLGKKWAAERVDPLKIRDFEVIPGFSSRVHGNAGEQAGVAATAAPVPPPMATPAERMEAAHKELQQSVVATLLDRIRLRPPEFLEKLVIELMSKLRYGDGTSASMLHTGKTADGGIDGKIKMDALGLEHIFLQAKRYDQSNTISREQVAAFAGSIAGAKGVFVTTSTFSKAAIDFIRASHKSIVLIDGQRLGELMLGCGLGVTVKETYQLHTIDEDRFADEE